jgi:hypothetical protein
MNNIIVGIHQPNFFPWLGYFEKILKSDVFVFLDNVQYSHGSWTNRVKIINQKKPSWITCPVSHIGNYQTIREIKIDNNQPWRKKISNVLTLNYAKSDFYSENYNFISDMVERQDPLISRFNIQNIVSICDLLDIKTKFVLQSDMSTSKNGTELLIEITQSVGGTGYICGSGARNYQEDQKFSENNITLIHQNFVHPQYPQKQNNEFVEGLSIIDTLLNCGISGTKKLLNQTNEKKNNTLLK